MQASVPEFPQRASIREDRAPPPYIGAVPATLAARVFAYLIDLVAIACITFVLVLALAVLAFPSLGLSLIAIWPVLVATPILYSGLTLSGRAQATFGMRLLGLRLCPVDGGRIDFLTAVGHSLLFYIFDATLTPLILLVGVFRRDRALLHDLVLRVRLVSAG